MDETDDLVDLDSSVAQPYPTVDRFSEELKKVVGM